MNFTSSSCPVGGLRHTTGEFVLFEDSGHILFEFSDKGLGERVKNVKRLFCIF